MSELEEKNVTTTEGFLSGGTIYTTTTTATTTTATPKKQIVDCESTILFAPQLGKQQATVIPNLPSTLWLRQVCRKGIKSVENRINNGITKYVYDEETHTIYNNGSLWEIKTLNAILKSFTKQTKDFDGEFDSLIRNVRENRKKISQKKYTPKPTELKQYGYFHPALTESDKAKLGIDDKTACAYIDIDSFIKDELQIASISGNVKEYVLNAIETLGKSNFAILQADGCAVEEQLFWTTTVTDTKTGKSFVFIKFYNNCFWKMVATNYLKLPENDGAIMQDCTNPFSMLLYIWALNYIKLNKKHKKIDGTFCVRQLLTDLSVDKQQIQKHFQDSLKPNLAKGLEILLKHKIILTYSYCLSGYDKLKLNDTIYVEFNKHYTHRENPIKIAKIEEI